MKLIGYLTKESLHWIRLGGNDSRGTVPLHYKSSNVAYIPLYIAGEYLKPKLKKKRPLVPL